jgi:hypothetical protein
MRKLKFTEQQIAFALQQARAEPRRPRWPQDGQLGSDLLSLKAAAWPAPGLDDTRLS